MDKKLLFVYNPVSGKGLARASLADIVEIYSQNDYSVTVHPTKSKGDGFDFIKEHASEYDLIAVSGGDGMLNEAVSGLMHIDASQRPALAYMPSGSTNDFAGTVGIPTNIRNAAKMSVDGKPFFCDAGKINDRYFAYVAAFGAFTSVSYDTSQDFKNIFGHLAYVIEGIRRLPTIKPIHMKITFDDKVIEDDFILGMVTNSLQVGGIKFSLGTAISLNDGMFEVLLIKKPQNATSFQTMISAFMAQSVEKSKDIISFKASKIKFETDSPIPWTVDGEHGGDMVIAEISNLTRAFSVII